MLVSSKKYWTISRLFSGRLGRMEVPQLPVISVVMPWKSLLSGWKLSRGHASEWLWMSMKPGATVSPENQYSLNNALACGFTIAARREMYGGYDRYLLEKRI